MPGEWRTRFAPAPTGWLHLGHAVNAVYVWGLARAAGGRVVLRIEDHDRGRCRAEYERGLLDDLEWLGLVPDEPPGPPPSVATHAYRQRDCGPRYEAALGDLDARGLVYACVCTRRTMAARSAAPDAPNVELPYPGTCRDAGVDPSTTAARRVRIARGEEEFDDLMLGPQRQVPAEQCGDVLVRDRSGQWTYQFAVVADDIAHGIDVVIRGADLLQSTGRQLALSRLLGRRAPPVFLHHPLVHRPDGAKLSKSDGDTGLRDLRAAGWTPARVLGEAARLGGMQSAARSVTAGDLAALFAG